MGFGTGHFGHWTDGCLLPLPRYDPRGNRHRLLNNLVSGAHKIGRRALSRPTRPVLDMTPLTRACVSSLLVFHLIHCEVFRTVSEIFSVK